MTFVMIDFEARHHELCDELSDIRLQDPFSERFDEIVKELNRNVKTWIRLGMPNGEVRVNLSDLKEQA